MHRFADLGEQIIPTVLSRPCWAAAVTMGGGVDKIDERMERVSFRGGRLLRSICSAVSRPGLTAARRLKKLSMAALSRADPTRPHLTGPRELVHVINESGVRPHQPDHVVAA